MDRLRYPFGRIITKPFTIKNTNNLQYDEAASIMRNDDRLQKRNSLQYIYPESEGKSIFEYDDKTWLVLDAVSTDEVKIISVEHDNALYGLFTFIGFWVMLCIISAGARRFAFGFAIFSLMIFGLVVISRRVGDTNVKAKVKDLALALNYE